MLAKGTLSEARSAHCRREESKGCVRYIDSVIHFHTWYGSYCRREEERRERRREKKERQEEKKREGRVGKERKGQERTPREERRRGRCGGKRKEDNNS